MSEKKKPDNVADFPSDYIVDTLAEFLERDIPETPILLDPILPKQGIIMIHAPAGVGKTWFGMNVAMTLATGGRWLDYTAPDPVDVLYVDGEMALRNMQKRAGTIAKEHGERHGKEGLDRLRFFCQGLQERHMVDLGTPEGQQALEPFLVGVDVLVIDNVSTLMPSVKENDADAWKEQVQVWLLDLRRRGYTVILIHHSNREGGQRGTTSRLDVLDLSIDLSSPEGREADEGTMFEMRFRKSRHVHGKAAAPRVVTYDPSRIGDPWTYAYLQSDAKLDALELMQDGQKDAEIARAVGVHRSQVGRWRKTFIRDGDLDE